MRCRCRIRWQTCKLKYSDWMNSFLAVDAILRFSNSWTVSFDYSPNMYNTFGCSAHWRPSRMRITFNRFPANFETSIQKWKWCLELFPQMNVQLSSTSSQLSMLSANFPFQDCHYVYRHILLTFINSISVYFWEVNCWNC